MSEQPSPFNAFRKEGYPTLYDDQWQPFWLDQIEFRLWFLFTIILLAFLAILPGFRGRRFVVFVRWSIAWYIALIIFVCNFSPFWERGEVSVNVPYKTTSNETLKAKLAVNVGLRGINITLVGNPIVQDNDRFDYNELFTWMWQQGKPGFGYDAGVFQKQYHSALERGLPLPILWVAEAFSLDYGDARIGRYYRQSGWFSHIFLWLAVPLFIVSNLLFQMVIQFGSIFTLLTGCSLLAANVVNTVHRSKIPLMLAFVDDSGETVQLELHYSWCFYMNLVNGIICIVIGLITMFFDLRFPDEAANFFGNDVLQSYEDYFAEPAENVVNRSANDNGNSGSDAVQLRRKRFVNLPDLEKQPEPVPAKVGLKRRTISERFSRFQKSTIRRVPSTTPTTMSTLAKNEIEMKARSRPDPNAKYDENGYGKVSDEENGESLPLYENCPQKFDTIGEEEGETQTPRIPVTEL